MLAPFECSIARDKAFIPPIRVADDRMLTGNDTIGSQRAIANQNDGKGRYRACPVRTCHDPIRRGRLVFDTTTGRAGPALLRRQSCQAALSGAVQRGFKLADRTDESVVVTLRILDNLYVYFPARECFRPTLGRMPLELTETEFSASTAEVVGYPQLCKIAPSRQASRMFERRMVFRPEVVLRVLRGTIA
jgi:hypothetical protein